MTIEEMHKEVNEYCGAIGETTCTGCRLRDNNYDCRWDNKGDTNTEDCYWFLVNEGLIGAPKQPEVNFVKVNPNGEEKCSLLNGEGITRAEKNEAIIRFCEKWGSCSIAKETPCPLHALGSHYNCYGGGADIDCNYQILVDAGLIKPPVNFTKANPDDAVKQADDVDRYEVHRKICDKLNDTYRKKNADYGNSFGNGFEEYGLIMPAIRLEDKFMRFKRLALGGKQNVTSESIKDTLLDLANYAIMTLVEMEGNNDN